MSYVSEDRSILIRISASKADTLSNAIRDALNSNVSYGTGDLEFLEDLAEELANV